MYQTAFYGLPSDVAVVGVWRALSADQLPPPVVCQVIVPTPTLLSSFVELYVNDIPEIRQQNGVRCRQLPSGSEITVVPVCGAVQATGNIQETTGGDRVRWYEVTCNGQLGWMAGAILRTENTVLYLVAERPISCPLPSTTPTPTPTPTGSTSTPTNTPSPTISPQDIIAELATYGITTYATGAPSTVGTLGRPWTLDELKEILLGVQYTASSFAFAKQDFTSSTTLENPKMLFQRIMGSFAILRVENGFQFVDTNNTVVADGCDNTQNAGCTSNDRAAVAFYGNFYTFVSNVQFTLIHELEHRFDNQSNIPKTNTAILSLSERLDRQFISDCGSPVVPTATPGGPTPTATRERSLVIGEVGSIPWTRGERGWGSGPSRTSSGGQLITNFQQNPTFQSTAISKQTAIYEAAADMFLNWVYRRNSSAFPPTPNYCLDDVPGAWAGFHNESWFGQTGNAAALGTPDDTRPGAARFVWMQEALRQIFQQHPTW